MRVPVTGEAEGSVDDNFDGTARATALKWWKLHVPQWAQVKVADDAPGMPGTWNPSISFNEFGPFFLLAFLSHFKYIF